MVFKTATFDEADPLRSEELTTSKSNHGSKLRRSLARSFSGRSVLDQPETTRNPGSKHDSNHGSRRGSGHGRRGMLMRACSGRSLLTAASGHSNRSHFLMDDSSCSSLDSVDEFAECCDTSNDLRVTRHSASSAPLPSLTALEKEEKKTRRVPPKSKSFDSGDLLSTKMLRQRKLYDGGDKSNDLAPGSPDDSKDTSGHKKIRRRAAARSKSTGSETLSMSTKMFRQKLDRESCCGEFDRSDSTRSLFSLDTENPCLTISERGSAKFIQLNIVEDCHSSL